MNISFVLMLQPQVTENFLVFYYSFITCKEDMTSNYNLKVRLLHVIFHSLQVKKKSTNSYFVL